MTLLTKIKESVDYIRKQHSGNPVAGIVLGSGLGSFARELVLEKEIPFAAIPHFPVSGVEGHKGSLLLGKMENVPVALMQGRVHFYEGFSMEELTYPLRVLKQLGMRSLYLTNAAGGMNPDFEVGDIMIISDHMNGMPNPLVGINYDELGPRFPDMSQAYDIELIELAHQIAAEQGLNVRKGIYIGVSGPSYETPAEYSWFRRMGGDAVGMSTVPEVIVARHMGIRCFGLSVITDLGVPGKMEFLSHSMVQDAAEKAEPRVAELLKELVIKSHSPL